MEDPIVIENFIAGNFFESRRHIDSHDPSTGKVLVQVPDSSSLEVDAAVTAATRAFKGWSEMSVEKRCGFLLKVADILEQRLDEFATAESRDQGKPFILAKHLDIPRAVENFRHFARTVPHMLGTSKILTESDTLNYTTRTPIGVAGLISPWNLPLYLLTFKLAPALACGNTVVVKPSEMTSLTAYKLCKVLKEVGIPDGVVNMVFGLGTSAGNSIVVHPDVRLISFTGSTATGKLIAEKAAPLFKKLSLEMGGKNASVVFADCNIEKAVEAHLKSAFLNSGQICLCTSRIYVQKQIYEEFLSEFVEKTRNIKVGASSNPGVFMGAVNSALHFKKVKKYIDLAIEEGGKIECGETIDSLNLPPENKNGYFVLPTIITGLKNNAKCMQEEIFGPVTCVVPFDTEEEAIQKANGTAYGLCATLWTSNVGRAHRVAKELQAGTVWTNCWLVRDMDMPFGGCKCSGIGHEGTKESYEFFTEIKTICIKLS